jgi:hypothetical protein
LFVNDALVGESRLGNEPQKIYTDKVTATAAPGGR